MNAATAAQQDILLIDDQAVNLAILKKILTKQGYRVRVAINGDTGISSAREKVPDLILLDIMMPGTDGYGVCGIFKSDERTRDIPVIFISALNEAEDRIRGFESGGVDFITKPFCAEEVLARVKTHLTLRHAKKDLEEKNIRLEETEIRLRRKNDYLTALHRISLDLLREPEPDGILQKILQSAAELTNVSDAFIHLWLPDTGELEIRFAIGSFSRHRGFRIRPGEGLAGKVWQSGQVMLLDDYQNWEGRTENPAFKNIRSIAAIPLQSRKGCEGVIGLACTQEEKKIGSEELSVLELFAKLASLALDNVRLYEEMKQEIAERRKTEKELERAKTAAESASRAKSEFLANMSHEIRTPMNAILGFLELSLEEPDLSDSMKNNLVTVRASAKSLLDLLSDILNLSRLERGDWEKEEVIFDLRQMMKDFMAESQMKCRNKGLEQRLDIDPELPRLFRGNPAYLRKVLRNFAENAVKFTAEGSISFSVMPWDEENMLHFTVRDTGCGIPACHLDSIFDAFTQADASASRKFGGTGLGTTISKRLVEIMGGRVWAESEEGKGSAFHFTIPLYPQEDDREIICPLSDSGDEAGKAPGGESLLSADPRQTEEVFQNLLASFDKYNPNDAEPWLLQLCSILSPQQMEAVRQKVEIFDFDAARNETMILMQSLGIGTEK